MSTPAPAVRKLAEPLAVKKKLAADAKAEAILGRCICAVRRTRSIFRRSYHWHRAFNSAVRTKAARRSSLDWGAHAPRVLALAPRHRGLSLYLPCKGKDCCGGTPQ